jgi:hypothetical protein
MKNTEEMTDAKRWELTDIAVKAFIEQYPEATKQFFNELKDERTEFGLMKDPALDKAHYRATLSFPVVRNENGDDDSLLPIIERYLPNFTKSKYYEEFAKRYPNFSPARKI